MRKWITALALAVIALPLAACGEEDQAKEPADAKRVLPYLA
jgi:hypothetical protein